jgi:hypothetical protein
MPWRFLLLDQAASVTATVKRGLEGGRDPAMRRNSSNEGQAWT